MILHKTFLIAVILVGVALIISGSRASVLGACVGLLIFLKANTHIHKANYSGLWTVLLTLASIYPVANYFFPLHVGSLFRSETVSRTILWERAWILSQGAPYLGVGFGGSFPLFVEDALYLRSIKVYVAGDHSSLMRLLVDLGFVGVILAGIPFVIIIRKAWKFLVWFDDPNLGIALFAVVGGSLANALFEGWLFGFGSAATVPFWLLLAMLSHQTYQAKRKAMYVHSGFPSLRVMPHRKAQGTTESKRSNVREPRAVGGGRSYKGSSHAKNEKEKSSLNFDV